MFGLISTTGEGAGAPFRATMAIQDALMDPGQNCAAIRTRLFEQIKASYPEAEYLKVAELFFRATGSDSS